MILSSHSYTTTQGFLYGVKRWGWSSKDLNKWEHVYFLFERTMFFSLGSPSSSFLLSVFHKSYLDSQSQLPYIPFSSQFLKISFLLLKIWLSLRSSIIFSYATPLTLLCAWLSQAFQQWTFWSSLSVLLHFLPVIFIILLLKKQRRG